MKIAWPLITNSRWHAPKTPNIHISNCIGHLAIEREVPPSWLLGQTVGVLDVPPANYRVASRQALAQLTRSEATRSRNLPLKGQLGMFLTATWASFLMQLDCEVGP